MAAKRNPLNEQVLSLAIGATVTFSHSCAAPRRACSMRQSLNRFANRQHIKVRARHIEVGGTRLLEVKRTN